MRLFLILASAGLALISLIAALVPSNHCVRHTKAMPIAGGIGAAGALLAALFVKTNENAGLVLSGLFLLVSAVLNTEYLTWHIDSDFLQAFFVVHSMLRKRTIAKCDVVGFTERRNGGVLHLTDGRRVAADSVVGLEDLVEDIESYQAELQGLQIHCLPDVPERLFRGYLKNPNDFVFLFVLLFCIFAACVFAPFWMMRASINLKDSDCVWVEIQSPSDAFSENGNVLIPKDEDSAYVCRNLRQVYDENKLNSVTRRINRSKIVGLAIPAEELDERTASRTYYSVRAILCDDEMIVSFEQTSAGIKGEAQKISRVMLSLLGIYMIFVCCFCIFVSNTPRFYTIVRLFVKEEWIND